MEINTYNISVAKAIFAIRPEFYEVLNLESVRFFYHTVKNWEKIRLLFQAGKIEELTQISESELEQVSGEDITLYTFQDGSGTKFASLIYDGDELWQDPVALDVIRIS